MKGQKEPATEEYYVYGWKVLVLMDVHTRLPLAMKVVKIQEYEGRWLVPLLEQAERNLGTRGHISSIVWITHIVRGRRSRHRRADKR